MYIRTNINTYIHKHTHTHARTHTHTYIHTQEIDPAEEIREAIAHEQQKKEAAATKTEDSHPHVAAPTATIAKPVKAVAPAAKSAPAPVKSSEEAASDK
jgi:hypothetical protein